MFSNLINTFSNSIPSINQHYGTNFKMFPIVKINSVEYDYTRSKDGVDCYNLDSFEKDYKEIDQVITFGRKWEKKKIYFSLPIIPNLLSLEYILWNINHNNIFELTLEDEYIGKKIKCNNAWFGSINKWTLNADRVERVTIETDKAYYY